MKENISRQTRCLLLLIVLIAPFIAPVQGQVTWLNNANGTWNWTTGSNWSGGVAPGNPQAAEVRFEFTNVSYTVNLDTGADEVLQGGLFLSSNSNALGAITLNLQGHALVFDGGYFRLTAASTGAASTRWTINNGTVQLGTATNAASLLLGQDTLINGSTGAANTQPFTFLLSSGVTLDTRNTANIGVAADSGSRPHNLILDLTNATLASGTNARTLAVTDSIAVGQYSTQTPTTTQGNARVGVLKLGLVNAISIGHDLILGQEQRPTPPGVSTNVVSTQGTLQYSAAQTDPVTLTVGRDLRVGVGDRAVGGFTNVPSVLNLQIGSAIAPGGVLYVGYKNQSQGPTSGTSDGDTSGTVTGGAVGGTLNAWVSEFRVGQNTQTAGSATGTFDFRHSTLGTLVVTGSAVVGQGTNASGTVYLNGGVASSQTLAVGVATGATRSLLSLDGTSWTVNNTLSVGALGDISLNVVDGAINLSLTSSDPLKFTIVSGGHITAIFDQTSSNSLWAIRQLGDQQSQFDSFVTGGLLTASGSYGASAGVFYDGTYTYYGIAAVPEPSTLLLIGMSPLAFLLVRYSRGRRDKARNI